MYKRYLLPALLLSIACGTPEEPTTDTDANASDEKLVVYTVNYPLQYLAERIGGDHVTAELPLPAGVDPAGFVPSMDQLSAYQSADVILLNGASYASWVDTVSLPPSRLVDTSAAFADRYIVIEDAITHSHGPEGEHSHVETVATTWLDPTLAIEQARAVRDALAAARPERESDFDSGLRSLAADLEALDERLAAAVSSASGLVASQPAFSYLARRYGLEIPFVRFDADAMPDADGWHELEHLLEGRTASAMLWHRAPSPPIAERLEEMGLTPIVLDIGAARPTTGDYLSVMNANAERLQTALAP